MWVLRYPAKIQEGRWLTLSDNNLLKGSLAHKLFEDYFNAYPCITEANTAGVRGWAEGRLREILEQQGALLLMPGRAAECERFVVDTLRGLEDLITQLQSADIVAVEMETEAGATFIGGELGGRLDLLARKADGTEVVIDIKWGGAKYRREALENSQYLQLAIYAHLRREATDSLPAVGYFIISTSQLLVLDHNFFPHAEVIHPKNGETLLQFVGRFERSWEQRRQQLDQGIIEVNVSGTEADESVLMDEHALANVEVYEVFSEFGGLVGWEADA